MSALSTGLGTVSFSGAATGTNTTALVSELVSAASGPKNLVQTKINNYNALSTLYTTLNSRISAMDTALQAIDTSSEFREFTGTSTDEDVFTVSTDGDAVAGAYEISVVSLAKAQIHTADIDYTNSSGDSIFSTDYYGDSTNIGAYSSTTDAIFASGEAGDITLTIGDDTETVSVDDTTTLAELASSIDELDGVSAYIVQIGTEAAVGSDGYQLFIQAESAGKFEGGDQFSLDFTTLTDSTGSSDTSEQAATNATATIAGQTITSATNSFEAIDGVTINAVSTGTATATVALDTSSMAAKVSTFVDAYNSMVTFITANSGFDSSGTNQNSVSIGGFVGESLPRFIQQRMSSIISSDYGTALGLSSSTQRTALSQLGVKTEQTGLLTFTSSTFETALGSYQTSIESIFSSTDDSFTDSMRDLIDDIIDSNDGNIPTIQTKLGTAVDRLESSLDFHNKRLTKYRARLTKQFTQLEALTSSFNSTKSFLTAFFAPKTTT
jgi:flagellar hook-associated protein 2